MTIAATSAETWGMPKVSRFYSTRLLLLRLGPAMLEG
jgi:hypothetical protein